MSYILKPPNKRFSSAYYFCFCIFVALFTALYIQSRLQDYGATVAMIAAILAGLLAGLTLFIPWLNNLRRLQKAISAFLLKQTKFSANFFFPSDLAKLSSDIEEICENSEKSKNELIRVDSTRRELLANAAHDIKGPLSVISAYQEECAAKLASGDLEAAQSSLMVCSKNTALLQGIILEIFEAAKFDNLEGNLTLEVCAIDEFLNDIVQKYQSITTAGTKHLVFRPETKNALLQADLGLLERAISNLIDNALKYTEANEQITVGSRLEVGNILIYISDNGRGIPERDLPFIFDRLYRVERDRSKEVKGSGFGLAIVKKIVEAHQGQVFCSSTLGAGSVFQLSIPALSKDKVAQAMAEMISRQK